MLEADLDEPGLGDERDIVHVVGEHAGGETDPFFEVTRGLVELVEDGELFLPGQGALGHEAGDVVAVAAM